MSRAVIAGIIGGIVVDIFLAVISHHTPMQIWQFIASTIVGQAAYTSSSYAVLGGVVHFVISIVWALLYFYVFSAIGQLRNWIAGAIVWGIVVDAFMTLILTVRISAPYGGTFVQGLLTHIVFYALPVALYLARAPQRA